MYELIFLGLITLASTHDLNVGTNIQGNKIFDENVQASPAIWRQKQNVTVNTTEDEVISRILVTDLRGEKDGDVKVVNGGEGQKTVTLELQSPTVLRGFDFHVEVYATRSDQLKNNNLQNKGTTHPSPTKVNEDVLNKSSTDLNPSRTNVDSSTKGPDTTDSKKVPLLTSSDGVRLTRHTETKVGDETKLFSSPSIISLQDNMTAKNKDVLNTERTTILANNVSDNSRMKSDVSTTNTPTLLGRDLKTNNEEARRTRDTEKDHNSKESTPVSQSQNEEDEDQISTTAAVPAFVALNGENSASNHSGARTHDNRNFEHLNREQSQRKERDTKSEEKDLNHLPRVLTDNTKTPPKLNNTNAENITSDQQRNSRSTENGDAKVGLKDYEASSTTSTTTVDSRALPSVYEGSTESPQIVGNPSTFRRTQKYPYLYKTTARESTFTNTQLNKDTDPAGNMKEKSDDQDSKILGSGNASTVKTPVISIQ